jgi:hypothetical protein
VTGEPVPEIGHLAFLLGTWQGEGEGIYPTISPFTYSETVVFGHVGRPFLTYVQRTIRHDLGVPAHGESGYLRPAPGGRVELMLGHTFGVVELSEGTVDGTRLELATSNVGLSGTAKVITTVERSIEVDGDVLRYTLRMAAVGQPLQRHLRAELHRAA